MISSLQIFVFVVFALASQVFGQDLRKPTLDELRAKTARIKTGHEANVFVQEAFQSGNPSMIQACYESPTCYPWLWEALLQKCEAKTSILLVIQMLRSSREGVWPDKGGGYLVGSQMNTAWKLTSVIQRVLPTMSIEWNDISTQEKRAKLAEGIEKQLKANGFDLPPGKKLEQNTPVIMPAIAPVADAFVKPIADIPPLLSKLPPAPTQPVASATAEAEEPRSYTILWLAAGTTVALMAWLVKSRRA